MKELVYERNGIKGFLYPRENDYLYLYISEKFNRIRKSLYTKNRQEALRKCFSVIDDYVKGVYQTPSFKKVCDDFLDTVSSVKKRETYEKRLKSVFYKNFKDKKINELDEKSINEFMFKRLKSVKPQTINRDVSVLQQVLKYARKMMYITEIPVIEKFKEDKERRESFTDRELAELLDTAKRRITETRHSKTQYERTILYYYIKFLVETGVRTGEALSITFKNIFADTAKLSHSKTLIREVYLNKETLEIINGLKETYRKFNIDITEDSCLFLNYKGKQIASFKNSFTELMKKTSMANMVGKNELTLYSLRHTYITRAIKANVPLATIALQCGTSVEMIEKNYNHLMIHMVKDNLK